MAKQWRCAVVGTSTVGQTHVRVIPTLPNATLAAVCDLSRDKARAALEKAGQPHVPIYSDPAQMLEKEQIDVVHIATPSGMHHEGVNLALERGKNVICEKPIEIQLD